MWHLACEGDHGVQSRSPLVTGSISLLWHLAYKGDRIRWHIACGGEHGVLSKLLEAPCLQGGTRDVQIRSPFGDWFMFSLMISCLQGTSFMVMHVLCLVSSSVKESLSGTMMARGIKLCRYGRLIIIFLIFLVALHAWFRRCFATFRISKD